MCIWRIRFQACKRVEVSVCSDQSACCCCKRNNQGADEISNRYRNYFCWLWWLNTPFVLTYSGSPPDATFTAFVPEDQLPLKLPLGEKVNVEISIVPPFSDPTLSLRVLDCFAYPVSKHSVWTLLHDGWVVTLPWTNLRTMLECENGMITVFLVRCPNPLDKRRSSLPLDQLQNNKTHSLVRRFDVKTFAFLDPNTGKRSAEKVTLPKFIWSSAHKYWHPFSNMSAMWNGL